MRNKANDAIQNKAHVWMICQGAGNTLAGHVLTGPTCQGWQLWVPQAAAWQGSMNKLLWRSCCTGSVRGCWGLSSALTQWGMRKNGCTYSSYFTVFLAKITGPHSSTTKCSCLLMNTPGLAEKYTGMKPDRAEHLPPWSQCQSLSLEMLKKTCGCGIWGHGSEVNMVAAA